MDTQPIKQQIETAFENFKAAVDAHNDINSKRSDGGWTVGEIADHMVKSTNSKFGRTEKTIRPYDQHAASIKDLFLDFSKKFPAAPQLQPELKEYSKDTLFAALEKNKNHAAKMIEEEDLTETCIDIPLPGWGALTKFEWLVLMENHMIRHTRQVKEHTAA